MNFFGHALVASWHSRTPAMALGAMLPDFASMVRGRVLGADDVRISTGIALHHRTDAVFHGSAVFGRLMDEAASSLRRRGVARGGALGAAHVAVELVLDGILLDDSRACDLYLAALSCPAATASADRSDIVWAESAQAERWQRLRLALYDRGLPQIYRDPDAVADRVALVLSRRPRLALSPPEREELRAELPHIGERVAAMVPALLAELRAGLDVDDVDDR